MRTDDERLLSNSQDRAQAQALIFDSRLWPVVANAEALRGRPLTGVEMEHLIAMLAHEQHEQHEGQA